MTTATTAKPLAENASCITWAAVIQSAGTRWTVSSARNTRKDGGIEVAQKTILICDHCKVEVEQKYGVPSEFMYVSVDLRRDASRGVQRSKRFHVCPSCQEKIGFVKPSTDDKPAELAPSTADQLYDLVAQIIQENLPS